MQFPAKIFFSNRFVNYEIVVCGNGSPSFGGITAVRFTVSNWNCRIVFLLLKVEHMFI